MASVIELFFINQFWFDNRKWLAAVYKSGVPITQTQRLVITQVIYYGQNSVDMRSLQAGMYVWKVVDGTQVVREGKVVKI